MDETPKKRTGRKKAVPSDRILAANENVVALFGVEPGTPVEPRTDPDQVIPANPGRDTGKRKKVRMGKRMTLMLEDINSGRVTMNDVVAAMDVEELARGQIRAKDGTFRGAPMKWVPAEFHAACMREMLKRGQALYRENFLVAVEAFTAIAKSEDVEPQHRLKAAQYIWERVEGKIPDKVEIGGITEPWEQIISGIVAEAEDEAISRATQILGS